MMKNFFEDVEEQFDLFIKKILMPKPFVIIIDEINQVMYPQFWRIDNATRRR
jgi:hypothetical protein